MPLAWKVKDARLESDDKKHETFADYSLNPQSIAVCCPPTPKNAFVRGKIIIADNVEQAGKQLKGKFLLLTKGKSSIQENVDAARIGALGILVPTNGPTPDACNFLNYSVPMDKNRPAVPCFSLSQAAVNKLYARLAENKDFKLKARVRIKRYAGTAPVLTGVIGDGIPEIYLCAHIDEIGALDNASGCGVAIEALRVMASLQRARSVSPQYRAIRFFFSTEVRGQQAWFNIHKSQKFLAGINLDMVGSGNPAELVIGRLGFRHRPHFAGHILKDCFALADHFIPDIPTKFGANYVSDGIPGIYPPGGNVSIEQKTGPTYHTSADTPDMLNRKTLKWTGYATVAFLYTMTRLDGNKATHIAKNIFNDAIDCSTKKERQACLINAQRTIKTILPAIPIPQDNDKASTPSEFYAAGVNRKSGLWPETQQRLSIQSMINKLGDTLSKMKKNKTESIRMPNSARQAPIMLQRGFLNFDGHIQENQITQLHQQTGLGVGWCTDNWAWLLASCFDGKHTIAESVEYLNSCGININIKQAISLAEYLSSVELARMRTILSKKDIIESLRKIGVQRGSTLLVHSSLSKYGYIKGGAETLIKALIQTLGPRGTLLMPTHSNSTLGMPPYNAEQSPSNTGAVTEYFRKMPGVIRSAHPTHSVAGLGPKAMELLSSHKANQAPLSRNGFWGNFYDNNGDVLLMSPISSETAFHVGETWLGLSQPPLIAHTINKQGHRRTYTIPNGPWHVNHFEPNMAKPLMKKGLMKKTTLGEAEIYLASVRDMIDISLKVNKQNPEISLKNKCTCLYCNTLRNGLKY
jgi:aminoglycoside 3-N-acetyltransferase